MGRLVKNSTVRTGSHAIRMPQGTSSIGPTSPQDGQVRFNIGVNNLEVFYSEAWHGIGQTGRVAIAKDTAIGDGVTTAFEMPSHPVGSEGYAAGQEADILVFVGNVFQEPQVSYTISGSQIEFTSAPDFGVRIVILHNFNSTHVR